MTGAFVFRNGAEHDIVIEYVCDVNGHDLSFCVDYHGDDLDRAVAIASDSDVAVIACGDNKVTSGEGMDRCSLELHGKQRELIRRVAELGKPTVLVLENGKPVDLRYETGHMDSILVAWFGGEYGARAIADILFGDVSPSGKLPVSFPKSVGHLPCYYTMLPGGSSSYLEGERRALFEFGYGLSYTSFAYSGLQVVKGKEPYAYSVRVKVSNTGKVAGDEVAQLYVEDMYSSVVTPCRLLQGFQRISLEPGEEKEVEFTLGYDSFRMLDQNYEWVVEPGEFRIMVGASSRDIRQETVVMVV